jgi:SdpI/YfhL protein family
MEIMLALYVFSGLLLAGLSVPLIKHKIPPNGLYGFRIPSTLENPDLWYKINEYSGWRFLVVGLGTSIGSSILYFIYPSSVDGYALSCLGWFLALFLWGIITSFLYLKSIQP